MALRQQVWVDRSVQGVLVGRVLLYWLCAILYVGIGSACFQYNQNPEWTLTKHAVVLFSQMWPWIPTVVLILPLAIYDVVRLSNLFVGPIYRLRKHFAALRQDIACAPLTFREDDYWRDLTAPINDMQAEILRLRSGVIELQQVASQTSAIMANFKANLPEDDAAASLFNTAELQNDLATNAAVAVEAAAEPAAYEVKVEDHVEVAARPAPSASSLGSDEQANTEQASQQPSTAEQASEKISPAAEVSPQQDEEASAQVAIAPIPIADATSVQTATSSAEAS